MKKKILLAVSLSLFLLSIGAANTQAGRLSTRFPRNNQANDAQQETKPLWKNLWSQSGQNSSIDSPRRILQPLADNEASMQWVKEQIDTVLNMLEQDGVTLPADMKWNMDWNLNDFFTVALKYLTKTDRKFPLPGAKLFGTPDYDLSWTYDPKTSIMDFVANRILNNDRGRTSIDLGGSLDLNGPWDLNFAIVNIAPNKDRSTPRKTFFQRTYSRSDHAPNTDNTASDPSKEPQANSPWQILRNSEFTFKGEICQNGLVSLYLNPAQVISVDLNSSNSYTTKSGLEIVQDAQAGTSGTFYLNILDNTVAGTTDNLIYHWETPLW